MWCPDCYVPGPLSVPGWLDFGIIARSGSAGRVRGVPIPCQR